MELKVRALDVIEPKGVRELENELVEKHEQSLNSDNNEYVSEDASSVEEPEAPEFSFKDEDVLSYIGKRYNKQINSLDDLVAERQDSEPLPEDVAAYLKYKKETGRGFEDFLQLKKDFDSMNPDDLLKNYLTATQEGLDSEDIETLMDEYSYDEDLDDESTIKRVKITNY